MVDHPNARPRNAQITLDLPRRECRNRDNQIRARRRLLCLRRKPLPELHSTVLAGQDEQVMKGSDLSAKTPPGKPLIQAMEKIGPTISP